MKRIALLLALLLWPMAAHVAAVDFSGTNTFQGALENNRTNQASTWVNPDTDSSGSVAPMRTYQNAEGLPCREFQQTIVIGGREEQGYGTACRQPDGTWRIVSGQEEVAPAPVERRTTVYVRDYSPVYGFYGYPYWYPFGFSINLGYRHHDGGHRHDRHYYGGHRGGGHHGGGHRR